MRRTVLWVLLSLLGTATLSTAEARKKRHHAEPAAEVEASAPDLTQVGVAAGAGAPAAAAPGAVGAMPMQAAQPAPAGQPLPPGVMPAAPSMYATDSGPEPAPMSGSKHSTPWKVAVAGGGIIGGSFVLSLLVGSMSYAGFTSGQSGWFAPIVGPALAMGGVGGEPGGCLSKFAYTYTLGPLLTLFTVGGIATTIAGLVTMFAGAGKSASYAAAEPAPKLQVAPSLSPGGAGLIVLGSF